MFSHQLVSLLLTGPELGPLAGLMVGPEQGGWQVDEVTDASSRSGHVDRYVKGNVKVERMM